MTEHAPPPGIVLVATNFGQTFGGEAIKVRQYAHHLRAAGHPLPLVSHERGRTWRP
jgi:hypothetical protein